MVHKRISRFKCKGCDITFMPKTRKQRYCSEECRVRYYSIHYFQKVHVDKTCLNCGNIFTTSMPKKQWYCSPECREDARKKRTDAVNAGMVAERRIYLSERVATFEHDGYKCTMCGRHVKDGAILDVVEEGAKLTTVCTDCKIGKKSAV